ncbi:MAG: hypothetical protein LUH10_01345 [Tannerellaceae bacterium]|nr:hypothetical protein [Tannerellaceae bacterium]
MKKCKYIIMTLLFLGATGVFTGCIDTDEPAGITELRGAKSELIKAQASLELANVAYRDAETAYKLAEVEYKLIENRLKELEIQQKQLELDLQAAKDEKEKAELQKELDKIANEREKIAEEHKAAMLDAQEKTARAQESYDNAMRAIEAAKLILTPEEEAVLARATSTFNQAKSALNSAHGNLVEAQGDYQRALLLFAGKNIEADLKHKLAVAQYKLDAVVKVVEEIEELLKKVKNRDVIPAAEWDDELTILKNKVADLKLELDQAILEKERITLENRDLLTENKSKKEEYDAANEEVISVEGYERPIPEVNVVEVLNEYVIANEPVAGYDLSGVFSYTSFEFTNEDYINDESSDINSVLETIDGWLELMKNAGVTNEEEVAHKKVELALWAAVVKEAIEDENDAIKAWEDALKVWEEADEDDKADAYDDLRVASAAAFGTALDYDYRPRLTQPKEEEFEAFIAAGGSYADLGAVGARMEAEKVYNTINSVVEQKDLYLALSKDLRARKQLVLETADENKDRVADLYIAYQEGVEAYDELFAEVNTIIDGQELLISEYNSYIEMLEGYIAKYLKYGDIQASNYTGFIEALELLLQEKQATVITLQGNVEKAQKELDMYNSEDKEYTEHYALKQAEEAFKTAMDAYNTASDRYQAAYETLQNVINVLLK